MISERERFRRITGLESEPRHVDYGLERRLFYLELVSLWGFRTHQRCRTCRACLRYDAADCEVCERWLAHLVTGSMLPKELR